MRVRIRLQTGPLVARERDFSRRAALAAASLLSPAAVMLGVLAGWALAADRGWSGGFAFASGPLADWRLWLAGAVLVRLASYALVRYGRSWRRLVPPIIDLAAEDPIRRDVAPPHRNPDAETQRPLRRGSAIMP
jgi:hypothetical protein